MAVIVAQFFQLIGLDMVPPTNIGELIPYLLVFFIGVVLVCGVFRVLGKFAEIFVSWRRW